MGTLVTAGEITALIAGTGAASVVLGKGFSMARRFGHFLDKLAGNGDSEPGILRRLEDLKTVTDDLSAGQGTLQRGQDDLTTSQEALKVQAAGDLAEVKVAVHEVKVKLDQHVDDVAPSLLADGQAWGGRIDARLDALEAHISPDPKIG